MMKNKFYFAAIIVVIICSAFSLINATNWKIANGYTIAFESDDPSGVFTSLRGDIRFDEKDPAASGFNVTVDVKSINTGNGIKNRKALGDKFFDADHYPEIKFTSARVEKTANGYETTGILEMHGVKKQLTIPFTFTNNTFKGSFSINRLDYQVGTDKGWNGHAASVLKINLAVPVTKN